MHWKQAQQGGLRRFLAEPSWNSGTCCAEIVTAGYGQLAALGLLRGSGAHCSDVGLLTCYGPLPPLRPAAAPQCPIHSGWQYRRSQLPLNLNHTPCTQQGAA